MAWEGFPGSKGSLDSFLPFNEGLGLRGKPWDPQNLAPRCTQGLVDWWKLPDGNLGIPRSFLHLKII